MTEEEPLEKGHPPRGMAGLAPRRAGPAPLYSTLCLMLRRKVAHHMPVSAETRHVPAGEPSS